MNDDLRRFWRPAVRPTAGSGDPRRARHVLVADAGRAVLSSLPVLRGVWGRKIACTKLVWLSTQKSAYGSRAISESDAASMPVKQLEQLRTDERADITPR